MKQDRRIRKSKTAMKKAVFELLHRKSFDQITIIELCEKADINRSTFYANYTSLNDLLKEIHFDLFEAMITHADIEIPSSNFEINDRTELITGMLQYIQTHHCEINRLFNHDQHHQLVRNMLLFFTQRFGYSKYNHQSNYPLIYHTVAFSTLMIQWVKDKYPISADNLAQLIISQSSPLYNTHEFISQLEKNHV